MSNSQLRAPFVASHWPLISIATRDFSITAIFNLVLEGRQTSFVHRNRRSFGIPMTPIRHVQLRCAIRISERMLARYAARRGFTAVELMVVIAIMAVLAALAAPSFRPLIERWRVNDAREAMSSALFLARSEAIKRGGNVVLEKTALGTDCPHASTAQEWSCGWFVYFDQNVNGAYDAGTDDVLLQVFPAPKKLNVMTTTSSPVRTRFTFDRWGNSGLNVFGFVLSPDPDGVTSPATSTLCVAAGGRIRSDPGEVTCS